MRNISLLLLAWPFETTNLDIAKPLKCNHSLEVTWEYQTSYETQWRNNGSFYWLFKVFDTIGFYTLMQKMHSLNFSSEFLNRVFNYLIHIQHFVLIDSNCSSFLTAKYGVPQVSILGFILFNLCVTDMSSITPNNSCIQHAYDSTIHRSCKINQKDTFITQPVITGSKLTIKTLNEGVKKPLALLFHALLSCSSVSIVKFEQVKFEKELKKDITSIAEWSNETNFVFNTSRTKICGTCNKQMSVWQKLKDKKFKIYCNGIPWKHFLV